MAVPPLWELPDDAAEDHLPSEPVPTPGNNAAHERVHGGTVIAMCRNITPLRGLAPPATREEIEAAALQYVRKVGSLSTISAANADAVDAAVREISDVTQRLLGELPQRRQPPKVEPPLRRIARAKS